MLPVTTSPASDASHPILARLLAATEGHFPPASGAAEIVPSWRPGLAAVVSFTGYAMIATPDGTELTGLDLDGFGRALDPAVLLRLAGQDGRIGVLDATLAGWGTGAGSTLEQSDAWDDHPRVRHARALRDDVRVFGDERGLVTLATGLAGRTELSVEVTSALGGVRPRPCRGRPGAVARERPGLCRRRARQRPIAARVPRSRVRPGR